VIQELSKNKTPCFILWCGRLAYNPQRRRDASITNDKIILVRLPAVLTPTQAKQRKQRLKQDPPQAGSASILWALVPAMCNNCVIRGDDAISNAPPMQDLGTMKAIATKPSLGVYRS